MLKLATHPRAMLHKIAGLFEALHRNDIVYCTLKGNDQHLNNALTGESDIDVLFDVTQKAKLESVLTGVGFKEFAAIGPRRFKDIVDFFALDSDSGKLIHLHTHFGFTMGEPFLKGYQPDIAEHILRSRIYNEEYGLYAINPALELTLLYLTETLKLRHRDALRILLRKNRALTQKAVYQHNWLMTRTSPALIAEAIETTFAELPIISRLVGSAFNQKNLHRFAPPLKKALLKYRLYSPMAGLWLRWTREFGLKVRRVLSRRLKLPVLTMRTSPRGGITVAMVDNNEALKATVITGIRNTFAKKIDVYHVRLKQGKTEGLSGSHNAILRCLGSIFDAADRWQKLKRIQYAKMKGALVICDYDIPHRPESKVQGIQRSTDVPRVDNKAPGYLGKLESTIRQKVMNMYPPDLVFRFTAAGHGEVLPDATTSHSMAHANTNKRKLVLVDTDKPLEEKIAVMREEIWKLI